MNGQSLKHLVKNNGAEAVYRLCMEGLEAHAAELRGEAARDNDRRITPQMFSVRELWEAFMGEDSLERLSPRAVPHVSTGRPLFEAGEAVDVTAFSNITGQIFYNRILEGWNLTDMVGENLVETIQTDLDGEKMPWITPILSNGGLIHTGMPYPEVGLAEEFITTPSLNTYGFILSIHKLTIFYDRTGQMLRRAGGAGERLRWNKEFRILDHALGVSGTPLFNWKGVQYSPYQAAGTYWSNFITSLPFADWTSFRQVEVQASKVLEPDLQANGVNTPIEIDLDSVLVMPAHEWDLQRVLHATELRSLRMDVAPNQQTIGGNVVKSYKPYVSKQLYRRAIDGLGLNGATGSGATTQTSQADDLWFMWDSKRKPIAYMQAWPIVVQNQPANSQADFERDIVFRVKASERGTTAWMDPRMIFQMRGTPT